MKGFGWIMAIVAGLIILYNVATTKENERQVKEHPWSTLFSGGSNLKRAYSFTPPYTGFEITVIAAGAIGVGIILFAPSKD
jgi:hypothetical protein